VGIGDVLQLVVLLLAALLGSPLYSCYFLLFSPQALLLLLLAWCEVWVIESAKRLCLLFLFNILKVSGWYR
jgi:hypothetical protein